ncbi:MAG TPA: PqqD family protein [Gemmatimonadaceae bacterium]|jgi:hypothetical protein|nr:PqqD family protein [Gemmatimonadaceae bacterium]
MMRDEETHPRDPSRLGPSVDGLLALEVDPSILAAYQGDRGVLLDYTNGEYFGLNEIAAFSWKMLSSGYQFEAIVNAIIANYQVAEPTARADLAAFLSDMLRRGLVRPVN